MKNAKELISFNAPSKVKYTFDLVCSEKGITRTHGLVYLMMKFIHDMKEELKKQDCELQETIEIVKNRRKMVTFKEFINNQKNDSSDLPIGFSSTDDDTNPVF
ncbi:hypothetical protein [Sphingorhabdus sp.]|jgi:hypothetical protein|uniref:hypothetical protein n=1 Tax=Sphingorhabdus sp. TaxID=1902408 RepID=UPI002C419396|nr:hypothetical protein [Sphingorhabdus sp.]HMT42350.1 hypothetical protein [Sphingorhabdus sp.]